jgi:hypothetical protein
MDRLDCSDSSDCTNYSDCHNVCPYDCGYCRKGMNCLSCTLCPKEDTKLDVREIVETFKKELKTLEELGLIKRIYPQIRMFLNFLHIYQKHPSVRHWLK